MRLTGCRGTQKSAETRPRTVTSARKEPPGSCQGFNTAVLAQSFGMEALNSFFSNTSTDSTGNQQVAPVASRSGVSLNQPAQANGSTPSAIRVSDVAPSASQASCSRDAPIVATLNQPIGRD
ncbi:hypothetical protein BaRGS_00008894 [Batillaria attramentaria]|uniref:Uncharacterized protein n=1 Tax=Batillaria attramentaria TaxID=370345 RepID=A0ABD0LLB0_9CAEN